MHLKKKRERYENFLKKVDILSTIDAYEIGQISEALKSSTFLKNDYIIKEGELGDVFYILEEGECIATKTIEPGKAPIEVMRYKSGDYFGERALVKCEPRACNIVAISDVVKVISLDRNSFKRLLGPIEPILQRNIEKYQKFVVKENDENA
jgi:cAMP-dependent protein kinase regulator